MRTLEKTVTNYNRVTEVTRRKEKALHKAVDAYAHLMTLKDYPAPSILEELTADNLTAFFNSKVEAVNASDLLTAEAKQSIIKKWVQVRDEAMNDVRTINTFIQRNPEAVLMIGEHGLQCETNLRRVAEIECTQDTPELAHEHWRLINFVLDAAKDLRKWERENDVKKFRLEDLARKGPQQFAEDWTFGNMLKDHTYDHYFGSIVNAIDTEFYI